MAEITSAVVATSLVLLAVFVPVAFFPGTTGQLYKQFALTIACSITISLFNALTLDAGALGAAARAERAGRTAGSSAPSTRHRRAARRRITRALPRSLQRRADRARRLRRGCSALTGCSCYASCRRASCRTRIRGSSSCTVQAPPRARRCSTTTRSMRADRGTCARNPEVVDIFSVSRLQLHGRRPQQRHRCSCSSSHGRSARAPSTR